MTANILTISELMPLVAQNELSHDELLHDCLARIKERESKVQAWRHLDPTPLRRKGNTDRSGATGGMLGGIPFGVKDIIDVRGMPTSCNSLATSRRPQSHDADIVAILRGCGALPIGKTDTVEFASGGRSARTRNPHDPKHTPGASSAGSAAAVADFMVPFALGTQTAGSIIRPAIYCGVFGFKPTHGLLSLVGVRPSAPSLDAPGWFTRSAEDLILVAQAFHIRNQLEVALGEDVRDLRLGLCQTPFWYKADPAGREVLAKTAARLSDAGAEIVPFEMPPQSSDLAETLDCIIRTENGHALLKHYLSKTGTLSPDLGRRVEQAVLNGVRQSHRDLVDALDLAGTFRRQHDRLFKNVDAVLTLGAAGVAPLVEEGTGDPIFGGQWSLMHAPAVAIPAGRDVASGLPVGVQLVGPRFGDARLLQIARVVSPLVSQESQCSGQSA